jgi:hypothetical protein
MSENENQDEMSEPCLLPPITAVQMVWALGGLFAKGKPTQNENLSNTEKGKENENPANTSTEESKENKKEKSSTDRAVTRETSLHYPAPLINRALEDIRSLAKNNKERSYIDRVMIAMDASLRSINTIYKGRNLNFDENKELRTAYLKSMKESIDYGYRLKDILTALPTMSVGAAGGATLAQLLSLDKSQILYWMFVVGFLGLGFFAGWAFVRLKGHKTQKLFIRRDYERKLYFYSYLQKVLKELEFLYDNVCRIYEEFYNKSYPRKREERKLIKEMLEGMMSHLCICTPRHMMENKIKPELWPVCEIGNECVTKFCEVRRKEKGKEAFILSYILGATKRRIREFLYFKKAETELLKDMDCFRLWEDSTHE